MKKPQRLSCKQYKEKNKLIWWLRKQFLRIKLYLSENLAAEQESLTIWYAVCYALGAAVYQSLAKEPSIWLSLTALEITLLSLYLTRSKYALFKSFTYVLTFLLGFILAEADALYHQNKIENNTPEISYLFGKIENIDKNYNGRTRLWLTEVNDYEHDLKGKYRITVNQNPEWLKTGTCVELIAQMPTDYTANPLSNYDTDRTNFYQQISRIGYAISPIFQKDCEQEDSAFQKAVWRVRQTIKQTALNESEQNIAAIITALTIGDKSEITAAQSAQYRTAGLAHLLAISGMHIGLIALLVLVLIRILLLPFGYGRYDWRKPAAIGAFATICGYFLISGQSISCRRAFIMTSLILLSILVNRRAISIRLWAIALVIVITIAPSSVLNAGFLMSFAAVLGITSFYERYSQNISNWWSKRHWYGRVGAYFIGILLTDLIASLMTMPYSIYYFHQISLYTSLANLLAAPLVAFWIMPALFIFLISQPFGGGAIAIIPLAKSISLLNQIAVWVSGLSGAKEAENLSQMPEWGIAVITIGLLWLCIWQARWRRLGLLFIAAGLIGFMTASKADFVFDKGGTTFACRAQDGRLRLTPYHKNRFLSKMWTNGLKSDDNSLICKDNKCICRQLIEFRQGQVIYRGKAISLDESGFINIDRGIYYKKPSTARIWHKKSPASTKETEQSKEVK